MWKYVESFLKLTTKIVSVRADTNYATVKQ